MVVPYDGTYLPTRSLARVAYLAYLGTSLFNVMFFLLRCIRKLIFILKHREISAVDMKRFEYVCRYLVICISSEELQNCYFAVGLLPDVFGRYRCMSIHT